MEFVEPAERKPMRGIRAGCCAWTEKLRAKSMAPRVRIVIFLFMYFFSPRSTCHSILDTCPFSLDDLVRPRQELGEKCQADLFCRLEVYDEFKLYRLLHRQITWLCALKNLVYVMGSAPIE